MCCSDVPFREGLGSGLSFDAPLLIGLDANMTAKQWFIRLDSNVIGPLSSEELRQLAEQQVVQAATPVSLDQCSWNDAASVNGLFSDSNKSEQRAPFSPPTPPPPPHAQPLQAESPPPFILTDPHRPNSGSAANRRTRRLSRKLPASTSIIVWLLAAVLTLAVVFAVTFVALAMGAVPRGSGGNAGRVVGIVCFVFLFPLLKKMLTHVFAD